MPWQSPKALKSEPIRVDTSVSAQCMYRLLFANDFFHVLGSRSYVSGLLIDTRVVALLGLRSHRDLISGQVDDDLMGRQILGA